MSKRGYVPIEGVQSPSNSNETVTAYIFVADFQETAKLQPWKAEMRQAQEVLQNPEVIFEAHRQVRGEESIGFCYIGWPERVPNKAGLAAELRQDQVLAVYVDFEFNIWEWRVERCNDGGYEPLKADCRFGSEVFNRQEGE